MFATVSAQPAEVFFAVREFSSGDHGVPRLKRLTPNYFLGSIERMMAQEGSEVSAWTWG